MDMRVRSEDSMRRALRKRLPIAPAAGKPISHSLQAYHSFSFFENNFEI